MNEKKLHQLKISYYKHVIENLPNGWIGTYRNRSVVYIIKDPNDPHISNKHRRRLYTNTKAGTVYKYKLEKRSIAKAELDKLIAEWEANYIGEPETIMFPLRKYRFEWVNKHQFINAVPNQNTKYKNTSPINYKGQTLRSKNELIAIQEIENMGFDWKAEIIIKIGKYTFCPDVVFYVPYIDKVFILELDGKMDIEDYCNHAEERRQKYIKAGFVENKDVLFFRLNNDYDFNLEDFRQLIKQAIERSVADIRLDRSVLEEFV